MVMNMKKFIIINTIYILIIFVCILFFYSYKHITENRRMSSNEAVNEATIHITEKYNKRFRLKNIMLNDVGIVVYGYCEGEEQVDFEVIVCDGKVFNDTYIQSFLEKEYEDIAEKIISKYVVDYEVNSVLNWYNEPDIGTQDEVLYNKYRQLGRIPLLYEVADTEKFQFLCVKLYTEQYVDLEAITNELKDINLPLCNDKIIVYRYNSKNDKNYVEKYEKELQ